MQIAYLSAGPERLAMVWRHAASSLCPERDGKQMPHKMPWHGGGWILIHFLYFHSLNNAALLLS